MGVWWGHHSSIVFRLLFAGARFSSWRSKALRYSLQCVAPVRLRASLFTHTHTLCLFLRTSSKTRSSRPVTAPKPFGLSQTRQSLEATAAALREDRKRREAEEAAERELAKQPFTAKEVPKSTTKPRFNKLMKDAEDRRKRRVQERIEVRGVGGLLPSREVQWQ